MKHQYEFTVNWFEYQKSVIQRILPPTNDEYHILEIGSYEGRSTVYYIDNYIENVNSTITSIDPFSTNDESTPLNDQTYQRFLFNVSNSKYPNKFKLYRGYSCDILPLLLITGKQYDYITIDGSHLSKDVIYDACLSYRLLKPNGVIFFDDYCSHIEDTNVNMPRKAIDCFLKCHTDMEVFHRGYHLAARKNTNATQSYCEKDKK